MAKVEPPRVETALICDTVRTEVNGKDILIGVYSGGIMVQSFPASLLLHAYLILNMPEDATGKFKLKITANLNGKEVSFTEGELVNEGSGPVPILLPIPLPEVKKEGELSLQMQFEERPDWLSIISRRITLAPNTEDQN